MSDRIRRTYPEMVISFKSIGHDATAHKAAWSRATKRKTPQRDAFLKTMASLDFEESLAAELLHYGLDTVDSQPTRSMSPEYHSPLALSRGEMSLAQWTPAENLKKGILVATTEGWETIVAIYKTGAMEQTWDVEIEGTHNFIGNGIVAHNTYLQGSATTTDTAHVDQLEVNDDYITYLTGSGLSIVGGALTSNAVGAAGAWQLHSSIANTLTPTSSVAGIFVNTSSTFDSWLRASDHLAVGGAFQNSVGFTVATTTFITASTTIAANATTTGSFSAGGVLSVLSDTGFVGIGTNAPSYPLHVFGQCVTGDTKLRRRRRRKVPSIGSGDGDDERNSSQPPLTLRGGAEDEWEYYFEDVEIKDIQAGDEILTLNEKTGAFEVQKVEKLIDMGVKPIYEMVTE